MCREFHSSGLTNGLKVGKGEVREIRSRMFRAPIDRIWESERGAIFLAQATEWPVGYLSCLLFQLELPCPTLSWPCSSPLHFALAPA